MGQAAFADYAQNAHIVAPADNVFGQAGKLQKGVFDVVYILIAVQMILVNVEDDRHGGVKMQKTAVVFAGFENEFILAAPRGTAQKVQLAADMHARVMPAAPNTHACAFGYFFQCSAGKKASSARPTEIGSLA